MYHQPCFSEEETEAQKAYPSCSKSASRDHALPHALTLLTVNKGQKVSSQ